jgi:hypothetical protein
VKKCVSPRFSRRGVNIYGEIKCYFAYIYCIQLRTCDPGTGKSYSYAPIFFLLIERMIKRGGR